MQRDISNEPKFEARCVNLAEEVGLQNPLMSEYEFRIRCLEEKLEESILENRALKDAIVEMALKMRR